MFREDVSRLFSNLILDPYNLKDFRLLVVSVRQDFINSVLNLRTLQIARQEAIGKGFLFSWRKTSRIDRALLAARSEIREKRLFLDDLERALEVAADNDYEEMERREFYLDALKEAEDDDASRYEKRLKNVAKDGERLTEIGLLSEIRKQMAEIFLFMEKTDHQDKRRLEWELYDPPSRVKEEYDEFVKRHSSINSEATKSVETSHETDDINRRVLCLDGSCIGVIGADGHCKVCGKPYPDYRPA